MLHQHIDALGVADIAQRNHTILDDEIIVGVGDHIEQIFGASGEGKALFSVVTNPLKGWFEFRIDDAGFGFNLRVHVFLDFDPKIHKLLFQCFKVFVTNFHVVVG